MALAEVEVAMLRVKWDEKERRRREMVRSMGMLDLKEPFIPQKLLRSGQWGSGALGGGGGFFTAGNLVPPFGGKYSE